MSSTGQDSDDLVMVVIVGAALVGFVLGIVFLTEPRGTDRYTELYFATYKVPLQNYTGELDFNYTGHVVQGRILGQEFWILGPDEEEEILVFLSEGIETRLKIFQTFKVGDTYLFLADATRDEGLFQEYPREVPQFGTARLRFIIANEQGSDYTYYYKTYLGQDVVDAGEVPVKKGERVDVISSFPAGTTDNEWTRVSVVLNTGENISFGFRTYR